MSKGSILIVEDEWLVALNIERALGKSGYGPIYSVATAEEATEMAEKHRPDLILMDITLEGDLDGITAARFIHERMDVPIIYLSAHTDAAYVNKAKATNPRGYITKPFDEKQLKIAVEMAMNTKPSAKPEELSVPGEIQGGDGLRRDIDILRSLVPICPSCLKVRKDREFWTRVIEYVKKHREDFPPESRCPDCSR